MFKTDNKLLLYGNSMVQSVLSPNNFSSSSSSMYGFRPPAHYVNLIGQRGI